MFKKILTALVALMALVAHGQTGVGSWRIHPFFVGSNIKNLIDTGERLYYLAGNDLFCLDLRTSENENFNKGNYLSDVTVTGIYYNYGKKYLAVTYANSNIDIIEDNGRVVNLPDIKSAVITGAKGINDVTFADGRMLVATDFGYVVFDDTRMEVLESRIYGESLSSLAQCGNWLLAVIGGKLRAAPLGAHVDAASAFVPVSGLPTSVPSADLVVVSDTVVIANADNGLRSFVLASDESGGLSLVRTVDLRSRRATTVQPVPDGFIASYVDSDSSYYAIDAPGLACRRVSASAEIFSANPQGDGTMWALGLQGVHRAGDDVNYYKPDGIGIKAGAFYMVFNQAKNQLYLSSSSDNLLGEWGSQYGAVTQIYAYDGSHWDDITPDDLPGDGVSSNWQLALDPLDAGTYVYPSRKYGVVKVAEGKIVNIYDTSNSNFGGSSWYKGACAFDERGNLWVVYSSSAASADGANNVAVLPRAKYEQATCSASDWIKVNVPGTKQQYFKASNFLVTNGIKVFNSGGYQKAFSFWTEDELTSRPTTANYSTLMDQDGKTVSWNNVLCMVTDHNGQLWAGLNNGVISLDPRQAFSEGFTTNHIKVPRNDGTGLADYLLDGSQINCIAVDGANRKWIGTNSSGLFLVSADGSQVLKQFTTDNSLLGTNTIYSVCCNPNSNSVYVLTPTGFLEYFSDTTPGGDSYSNVYVYPNPVRPDFMGNVVINGLMDNSLVKIADASGQVVKQLRSVGGMATWDCCNDNGDRVSTGVYFVLASEKEGDGAHAAVAKFLVVR